MRTRYPVSPEVAASLLEHKRRHKLERELELELRRALGEGDAQWRYPFGLRAHALAVLTLVTLAMVGAGLVWLFA